MRKLLITLTLLCACALVFSFAALADEQDGWVFYLLEDNTVQIDGYTGTDADVTVPATLGGYTVSKLRDCLFASNTAIETVTVQDGIADIGKQCFLGCSSLKSISLPESVTTLGEDCFYECGSLESVNIPSGVTELGGYTFFRCGSLKSIVLPSNLKTIGELCFDDCSKLESIVIPSGVKEIGRCAFYECDSLKTVSLPDSITSLGEYCFERCGSLTSVTIPKGITSLENGIFKQCASLKQVTIPSNIKSVGYLCFADCTGLTGVTISSGVETLDEQAFINCDSLTEVELPEGVKSIGESCFGLCDKLEKAYLPKSLTTIGNYAFDPYGGPTLYVYAGSQAESWANTNGCDHVTCYTFEFVSNGGSAVKTQRVESGKTAKKPADPTKDGYAFVGWFKDSGLTTEFDFSTPITANTTVYAKWSNTYFTVTFQTNGGSAITSQNVLSGKTAVKPADPTKEGSVFAGWYSNSALTTAFDFSKPITADTTVYAKWTTDYYTVTFETNGGSSVASQNVEKGAKASKPADPTKDGYAFAGWFKDAALTTPFDFSSAINADTTVYAKWNEIFTVIFDSNGGSFVTSQAVESGNKAVKPSDPVNSGFTFAGWYADAALTTPFDFSTPITANITLYAKWTETTPEPTVTTPTPGETTPAPGTTTPAPTTPVPTTPAPTTPAPTTPAPTTPAPTATPEPGPAVGTEFTSGGAKYRVTAPGEVNFTGVSKSKATVKIPDTVTYEGTALKVTGIADKAFLKDKKLKTVTLGANVAAVGANAFKNCAKLATVKGGAAVTSIGDAAFAGCKALKKFPAMDELESIGAKAFKGCVKLTKFTFGEKVNDIGKSAFAGCKALKTVTVKTALLNDDNVGAGAFKGINKKAAFKCPKEQKKAYKKLFVKKGAPKSCKFK